MAATSHREVFWTASLVSASWLQCTGEIFNLLHRRTSSDKHYYLYDFILIKHTVATSATVLLKILSQEPTPLGNFEKQTRNVRTTLMGLRVRLVAYTVSATNAYTVSATYAYMRNWRRSSSFSTVYSLSGVAARILFRQEVLSIGSSSTTSPTSASPTHSLLHCFPLYVQLVRTTSVWSFVVHQLSTTHPSPFVGTCLLTEMWGNKQKQIN